MGTPTTSPLFDSAFVRRLEQLHVMAKRLAVGPSAGRRRARRVGDGLEFADNRPYAVGDDVRFVDWPYYARMDRLVRRLFHEHSEAGVAILLDASASMTAGGAMAGPAGGAFDSARRAAAALAFVAMASLEQVIVQPFAEALAPPLRTGRHTGRIFEALDFLTALTASGPTRLLDAARRFAARLDQPTTVLVISDLADCADELSGALAHLQQAGCDTTVLHLYAPAEADPKLTGAARLTATEAGDQLDVELTPALLAAYRDRWRQWADDCRRACVARGAIYVAAATDVPLEALVLGSLRRAGVLVR